MAPEPDVPAAEGPAVPRMRGLWSVMHVAPPDGVDAPPADVEPPPPSAASETPPPVELDEAAVEAILMPEGKSLWEVMAHQAHEASSHAAPAPSAATERVASPVVTPAAAIGPIQAEPRRKRSSREEAATGTGTLWLGLASLPLAGLTYFPGLIAAAPLAITGFLAMVGAALTITARDRLPGALTKGLVGMIAAALGLAAGPFVIAPWGNADRNQRSILTTQQHLETIGGGLANHLTETGWYPVGGTRLPDAQGRPKGGHGWMTRLLPYIDRRDLYERILLQRSYDDPVNRAVMGTEIETYYAAGGQRKKLAGGYAVAHFAGVGGKLVTTTGQSADAGIFGLARPVRAADLIDGQATTIIVGEVPGGYAPWGDPENWRVVTKGLNRDTRGFGNTAGTGAMLLFADGSVRFLPNSTDVDLLKRLTTRNGREAIDPAEFESR
jgi:hypothetical protein